MACIPYITSEGLKLAKLEKSLDKTPAEDKRNPEPSKEAKGANKDFLQYLKERLKKYDF